MIPTPRQLAELSRLKEGSLTEVPFAVLLRALEDQGRTAVLEIRRNQLEKKILLEDGTPVDCRSNLLHETLGKFLVQKGRLTEADYQRCLSESASTSQPFGETLMKLELVSAFDFFRLMQQNLAQKLLDGFTWREGTFHIHGDVPHVESPLKVRVPQLVLTGITRFAPQAVIDERVAPLVGVPLAVHPSPPVALDTLKLNPRQVRVLQLLKQKPRLDQLAADARLPFEELTRLLYALALLGVVVKAEDLPALTAGTPVVIPDPSAQTTPSMPAAALATPQGPSPAEVERVRNDVTRAFMAHRRQDAFELLGVAVDANPPGIRARFLQFCEQYAPWKFTGELASLADKAADLFVAGSRAFALLSDAEQRNSLIWRKQNAQPAPTGNPNAYFAIRTDLLDADAQFREGLTRMAAGRFAEAQKYLEFASDCDPQNGLYRAELAWCRYRDLPSLAPKLLPDLQETMRMDPECGVAVYYAGELFRAVGDVANAEAHLRRACKMMVGDRRPVEALKALVQAGSR